MKNEAHARIKINQLLTDAGWRYFDDEKSKDEPSVRVAAEPDSEYVKKKTTQ